VIAYYDENDLKWYKLPTTVDTYYSIVEAKVSHFTSFALVDGAQALTVAPPPPAKPTVPTTTSGGTVPSYPVIQPTTTTSVNPTNIPAQITQVPATFNLSKLTISPSEAKPGDQVNISIWVQNSGDVSGTCEVALKINDVVTGRKILNLAARTRDEVTFKASQENIGEYSIDINGISGKFTVVDAGSLPSSGIPSANNNWIIILSIAAFTLSMVVTITVAWRKMRKA
jgi:hypothetical protein